MLFRRCLPQSRRRPRLSILPTQRPFCRPPRLEALEDRRLLSTYVVTNTADSGLGSLRQAILDANTNAGADTIAFAIGTGAQTITPLSALPTITDPVALDGTQQPGYVGSPLIVLQGAATGQANYDGLTITAGNCVIRGLVINRFLTGITLSGSDATGNVVAGNFIGTGIDGRTAEPNSQSGVFIFEASGNLVGGTIPADRNVLSGIVGEGVWIYGTGATGNVVSGNYVGLDVAGTTALPNSRNGVLVSYGAHGNVVGPGNVVSGNEKQGVRITGITTTNNVVRGNLIGLAASGTSAIANGNSGVLLDDATTSNTIGGPNPADRNVISGNTQEGVRIYGDFATGNVVSGNTIGLDVTGTITIPNRDNGVLISEGANANVVGPGNVISGNVNQGVRIHGSATTGNVVRGNLLGLDVNGTLARPNSSGVLLDRETTGNTVGGPNPADRNVISGNTYEGVWINGVNASNNSVLGNYIGLNIAGTTAVPNGYEGVLINAGAHDNLVGPGNVISGNTYSDVSIFGSGSSGNIIQGNYIGFASDGTTTVTPPPNNTYGIRIGADANDNLIGGTADGAGNRIASNHQASIIINNWTGTTLAGTAGVGNAIRRNSIFAGNLLAAIELFPQGNRGQVAPVLVSAFSSATGTRITGTLTSTANRSFTLEFFVSSTGTPAQGQTYLGQLAVTTDGVGVANLPLTLLPPVAVGQVVTATVTDEVTHDTSAFSNVKDVIRDESAPASSVAFLPAFGNNSTFPVTWSGNDGSGAGIASYDVFVSDDGAPFTLWQSDTTQTSAMFAGTNGHTYRFYSVATDHLGHREPAPPAPDATTVVDTVAPTSSVNAPFASASASFPVNWAGSDTGSGIANYSVFVSVDGRPFALWRNHVTTTSDVYPGLLGHRYGFYSVAVDVAGNIEPTPAAAQATAVTTGATYLTLRKSGNNVQVVNSLNNGVINTRPISDPSLLLIQGSANLTNVLTINLAAGGEFTLPGGIRFDGGAGAGDRFSLVGAGTSTATLTPGTTRTLAITGNIITLTNVESDVVTGVQGLAIATTGSGTFTIDRPVVGQNRLYGTGIPLLTFLNLQDFTLDLGNGDAAANSNALTINTGWSAAGLKNVTITGGPGSDSVTHYGSLPTLPVAGGVYRFDGGAGADLVAAIANTSWTLTDAALTSVLGGRLDLVSVEQGRLTGGVSNNVLDSTGFSSQAILSGGAGNDTLRAGSGSAVLLGGAGNDILQAGVGRGVLIGGAGADWLTGGANDDLLIHGSTAHEANTAALLALLAEWQRQDKTYAERIANLRSGTGLNGSARLTAATVFDDFFTDRLTGAGGSDWFWAKVPPGVVDALVDRAAGEVVN